MSGRRWAPPTIRCIGLLLDRYIAAVDAKGAISTGHSALELPPDLYISHYPAVEIDHSPTDFFHLFRATPDNDVPGRFQPSYAVESGRMVPGHPARRLPPLQSGAAARVLGGLSPGPDLQPDLPQLLEHRGARARLRDRGLPRPDGVGPYLLLRVLLAPELWAAAEMRQRARTMAWTPGILLDYAIAMRALQDPPASGLLALARLPLRAWRRR